MRRSAVNTLVVINVLVYVLEFLSHGAVEVWFALWPLQRIDGVHYFHLWQIVTYAFLHSTQTILHLLFNMLGLWMFGTQIERVVGPRRVLEIYFASVVAAAVSQLYVPELFGARAEPTIGASGGVFGLLLVYAVLFPRQKVIPLIPPIPMPAWLFATLYAGVELVLGVTGTLSGVAHFAHLGGMIGAALVLLRWRLRRA
jgi:membrane associated rhomboid family serine protease